MAAAFPGPRAGTQCLPRPPVFCSPPSHSGPQHRAAGHRGQGLGVGSPAGPAADTVPPADQQFPAHSWEVSWQQCGSPTLTTRPGTARSDRSQD